MTRAEDHDSCGQDGSTWKFQTSRSDYQLNHSRIDIWEYPLHTVFKGASALLDNEETQRANRYYFPRHQHRFTVARAMLRIILSRYLDVSPQQLQFTYNPQGKPELNHSSGIQFNLSHSGELALLAIGQNFPLGVDLEFFSARPFAGIGDHLFSLNENKAFAETNKYLKPLVFFHIWVQKEAFIKACGLGLSYPTKAFDVNAGSPLNQRIMDNLHHKEWQMTTFMPKAACSAALCYHPQIETLRYFKLIELSDYEKI